MSCFVVFPLFLKHLTNAKSTLMSLQQFINTWSYLDRMMFDKMLYAVGDSHGPG
jgi:hypothetical protein